ncbi:MAG: MBL fold metallo-hydrolase [Alloprevotella sp.]
MQYISFGSGSSGNSAYLIHENCGILLDAGLSFRTTKRFFSNYGLTLSCLQAILLTHDHTDHSKSVGAISEAFRVPVFATAAVHNSVAVNHHIWKKVPAEQRREFEKGDCFEIGPFRITVIHVPHDSADNNGFCIEADDKCVVLLTDIGHFTDEMAPFIARASHLIVEANYDPEMLRQGPYPARLKHRITSPTGHSANAETAEFLALHASPSLLRHVWLCHLSAENNRPELARRVVTESLTAKGFSAKVDTLPRREPTPLFEL